MKHETMNLFRHPEWNLNLLDVPIVSHYVPCIFLILVTTRHLARCDGTSSFLEDCDRFLGYSTTLSQLHRLRSVERGGIMKKIG